MQRTTFRSAEDVKAALGRLLGESQWREISQEQVDRFADATGDHQWIHVDPERAADGPFGGTIAHGYLTLSLAPVLLEEVVQFEGMSTGVNYGCNKVRFVHPVRVGSNLRMSATLAEVDEISNGVQATVDLIFEIEGIDKPACVAQAIYRWIF